MRGTGVALASMILAGSFATTVAYAAPQPPVTPMEQQELNQLNPDMRAKVEARMKDGQTVHGILETMLLNQVESSFGTRRVVATDFGRGDMVVEGKDGKLKDYPFDVTTLMLRR